MNLLTATFNRRYIGLDFEAYQSHSIYISRYPYGREATLSFPAPDLVVTNPTPYAVLVWTSYDDTSITVELYSTAYFAVEQAGQTTYRWGKACRRVNTYRNRTAPDGTVLDPQTWFFETGDGSEYGIPGWGNNELQYYTGRAENIDVSGGTLKISARLE